MFTVVISEKQHLDTIKKNKLILGPILDEGMIAFCEWDPNGDKFETMVPDLWKILEGKDVWHGILIAPDKGIDQRNPFDFVRNTMHDSAEDNEYKYSVESTKKEYETATDNPVTRLSTYLFDEPLSHEGADGFGGLIKETEKEIEDVIKSGLREELRSREVTDTSGAAPNAEIAIEDDNDDDDIILSDDFSQKIQSLAKIEELKGIEAYYQRAKEKREMQRSIIEADWEKPIIAPTELICVSLRTHDKREATIATAWEDHFEIQYSSFCDRNLYYDPMRFLVFDIKPKSNSLYNLEYLRFLYSVILIAGNKLPLDSLRARRLYRIDAKDDIGEIKRLIVSYDEKLSNTENFLEEEANRIETANKGELSQDEVESQYCSKSNVPVNPDSEFKESSLYADWNALGLARDCAMNESSWWQGTYKNTCDLLRKYVKIPMRATRKGVGLLRELNEPNYDNVKKLNRYQVEDIAEFVDDSEEKMVSIPDHRIETIEESEKRLEKTSAALKKEMSLRMNLPLTLGLGIGLIFTFLLGFMPLLNSNLARFGTRMVATIFIAVFMTMLIAVQLGALIYFRKRVKARIGDFNATVHDIISGMKRGMALHSEYLSYMCSVMRGKAAINFYNDEEEIGVYAARVRRKHANEIRKKREDLALSFGVYLADKSFVDEGLTEPYLYDFSHTAEYEYPLPIVEGDESKVEFMQYGNYISVPFAFVKYMMATLEELYD